MSAEEFSDSFAEELEKAEAADDLAGALAAEIENASAGGEAE
jgi:hypothetical protein